MKEFYKAVRIYLDKAHNTRYNKPEVELSYQDCLNLYLYSSKWMQEKLLSRCVGYICENAKPEDTEHRMLDALANDDFVRFQFYKLLQRRGFNVPHLLICANKFIEGRTA